MLSKDRLSLAINHKEPDHIPLSFEWIMRQFVKDRTWRDGFERAEMELKLGLDPIYNIQYTPAWKLNPDVKIKLWRDPSVAGEEYAVLFKEYHTEKGVLRQVVRQTPDWPHGEYVPLWDDYLLPRSRAKKYLVEDLSDLEAFESLFNEPTEKELRHFLDKAEYVKRFADKHGVFVKCSDFQMTDAALYSIGMENMISSMFRNPELIHRMLDILLEWNLRYLQQVLSADVVDMIKYEGWFESFFPPKQYRIFIFPRVRKIFEMAHNAGVKVCYGPRNAPVDFFSIFKEVGTDVFWGCDPLLMGKDFARVKNEVEDKICFWGGVDSYVTLGTGTKKQIENAVTEAIRTLAPGGGFILSAFDSLDAHTPWSNIEHMLKVWRKNRTYPINI